MQLLFVEVALIFRHLTPALSGLLLTLLHYAVDLLPLIFLAGRDLLADALCLKLDSFFLAHLLKALFVLLSDFLNKALESAVLLHFVSLSDTLIIQVQRFEANVFPPLPKVLETAHVFDLEFFEEVEAVPADHLVIGVESAITSKLFKAFGGG